ncbi:hypothetical protein F5Y07DRAFT_97314 [Xylaria sp. FL0933]|nr:hypothetical protein F5Y07DRAFT_97314 [Xylaria sp. FL0933]
MNEHIELAEYQRKHGTNYESGVPDPNNAMLAASEEIQRQIAHAIRPHSHSEAANRRSERRRKSQSPVIERTSHRGAWSSPFGPNGQVADSVEHLPRRNRVSFKTSADHVADRHSNDHSIGARHDGNIAPAAKSGEPQLTPAKPPSPASNGASYVSEQDLDGISFDKGKPAHIDELFFENNGTEANHDLQQKSSREDHEYDKSDQTNPRTHQCNRRCTYVNCPLCSELHCSHEQCPPNNQTNYTYQPSPPNQLVFKANTTSLNTTSPGTNYNTKIGKNNKNNKINIPPAVSPLPSEPQTARNSTENLTRFPPAAEETHYTLPAPTESEDNSGVSDSDREMEGPHWSRNDLALPSSKSSSPSTHGQGGYRRRRRSSTAVRPVENGAELLKGVSDISGEKPQKKGDGQDRSQTGREQRGDLGYETQRRRRQRLDGLNDLDKRPVEGGQRQRQPGSAVPRTLEDREVSWGEGPSLYMPETPSRGPSGRRRPRRPPPAALVL